MTTTIPLLSTKGYDALWNLSNSNHKAFYVAPSSATLRELMENATVAKGDDIDALYDGEVALQVALSSLNEIDPQSDKTDAGNAPIIRAALPEITPARAADHRLWASVNCFALLPYTGRRWNQSSSRKAPVRTNEERQLREWVQEHFLSHGVEMKQSNAAARLWWLTEMARRIAPHSKHSADRLLSAIANDVEMYHQVLRRPYLASNARLIAQIYDLALAGNEYLLRRPYPNRMLQNLNIKAAAVSLGTLSDASLKQAVEEAKPPKGTKDIE